MFVTWSRIASVTVCGASTLLENCRKSRNRKALKPPNETVVVILKSPLPGIEGMPTLFENDALIGEAVKRSKSFIMSKCIIQYYCSKCIWDICLYRKKSTSSRYVPANEICIRSIHTPLG